MNYVWDDFGLFIWMSGHKVWIKNQLRVIIEFQIAIYWNRVTVVAVIMISIPKKWSMRSSIQYWIDLIWIWLHEFFLLESLPAWVSQRVHTICIYTLRAYVKRVTSLFIHSTNGKKKIKLLKNNFTIAHTIKKGPNAFPKLVINWPLKLTTSEKQICKNSVAFANFYLTPPMHALDSMCECVPLPILLLSVIIIVTPQSELIDL